MHNFNLLNVDKGIEPLFSDHEPDIIPLYQSTTAFLLSKKIPSFFTLLYSVKVYTLLFNF